MNTGTYELSSNERGWDSSWATLPDHMVQLYTRDRCRSIHQFWQRCYFEDFWNLLGPNAAAGKYLELGAGRGTTSMYLSSKNCDVTMLDLSSEGFRVAEENFAREGLRPPTMVQADARNTGLESNAYDGIVSIGLLEHFEDPLPVLAESVRLLRPGGLQFAVIIPERPDHITWVTRLFLRPWTLPRYIVPRKMRRQIRRVLHCARTPPNNLMRTRYCCRKYKTMLDGMDVEDVQCVPYNGYHPVYKSAFLEANVAIVLYNLHHKVKRLFTSHPLLLTHPRLNSCYLLTFRKRAKS
jgi:ubiquinone/menaquinone biosynthesis C-methylase UbiE